MSRIHIRLAKIVEREIVLGGFDMTIAEEQGVKGQDQEQMPAEAVAGNGDVPENVPDEGGGSEEKNDLNEIIERLDAIKNIIDSLGSYQNKGECIERLVEKAKPNNGWTTVFLAVMGFLCYAAIIYDKLKNPDKMNLGITITIAVCGTILLIATVYLYVTPRKAYYRILSETQDLKTYHDIISNIVDPACKDAMYEKLIEAKLKNQSENL